jgi:RHS repeat-associated protein
VDANGNLQTSYLFDPFGTTAISGQSNGNEFQYTGREDEGNGLFFYRARYYNPLLGRFISEDPLGIDGADYNLYAYALNDPINSGDPMGTNAMPVPAPGPIVIDLEGPAFYSLVFSDITLALEILDTVRTINRENDAYDEESQAVHRWNQTAMARRYSGGGGDGGCYTDSDVKKANQRYPKKAGRPDENHHIVPQYLGGDPNGLAVSLPAAYHQLITNAFRNLWPYGSPKPSPKQLQRLMDQVYKQFPWKKCR